MNEKETKIAGSLLERINKRLESGDEPTMRELENYKGFISACSERYNLESRKRKDIERDLSKKLIN